MKRRRKRRWPPLGILQGSQRQRRVQTLTWRQKVAPSNGEQACLFTLGTSSAGVEGAELEPRGQGTLVQQSRERSPLWDTFRAAGGHSSPVPSLKCS